MGLLICPKPVPEPSVMLKCFHSSSCGLLFHGSGCGDTRKKLFSCFFPVSLPCMSSDYDPQPLKLPECLLEAGSLSNQTGDPSRSVSAAPRTACPKSAIPLMTRRKNTFDVNLIKNTPSTNYLRYPGKLTE